MRPIASECKSPAKRRCWPCSDLGSCLRCARRWRGPFDFSRTHCNNATTREDERIAAHCPSFRETSSRHVSLRPKAFPVLVFYLLPKRSAPSLVQRSHDDWQFGMIPLLKVLTSRFRQGTLCKAKSIALRAHNHSYSDMASRSTYKKPGLGHLLKQHLFESPRKSTST